MSSQPASSPPPLLPSLHVGVASALVSSGCLLPSNRQWSGFLDVWPLCCCQAWPDRQAAAPQLFRLLDIAMCLPEPHSTAGPSKGPAHLLQRRPCRR